MTGITVKLYEKTQIGTDEFNRPIYEEIPEEIENVLIAPASVQEVLDTLNLTGKKIIYNLGIPKGDTHTWEDKKVEFLAETWRTVGYTQEGIEMNVPTKWHKKVQVERYG